MLRKSPLRDRRTEMARQVHVSIAAHHTHPH